MLVGDARRPSVSQANPISASHIVMFEDSVDPDRMLAELESQYGVGVRFVYQHALNGASLIVPDDHVAAVASHPGVKHLESNGGLELTDFPVDQEVQVWMERSGLDASHPFAEINGDDIGLDVDIAIIDTGVDGTHPDLNLHRAWNCVFDGVTNECITVDPALNQDVAGHGTRVAGAAAARDNGIGIVGTAPGARIWSYRLIGDHPVLGPIGGFDSDELLIDALVAAIDSITANAADVEVVNMSVLVENNNSAILRSAIQGSVATGIAYFVSAGNAAKEIFGPDGVLGGDDDLEPASYPEVATISGYADTDGASGSDGPAASNGNLDDTFYSSSNFSGAVAPSNPVTSPGAAIDFAMPAVDIMTTCVPDSALEFVNETLRLECINNDDGVGGHYRRTSGTSFSTPQAAGLAALLIARNGTRDINGDSFVDELDTYALRQILIDLAVAHNDADFGLKVLSGDPDNNPDPLGSARMVLNFDLSDLALLNVGSSHTVTVNTPFVPLAMTDGIQLNVIHDSSKFTVQNPLCGSIYSGGTPSGPTPNSSGNGTLVTCALGTGPEANSGSVVTFDVVRSGIGVDVFTLDGGGLPEGTGFTNSADLISSSTSPSFNVGFATISGSYGLQAVTNAASLSLVGPSASVIPISGSATEKSLSRYNPSDGTIAILVGSPGEYHIQANASGFLPRLFSPVVPITVAADGTVTGAPPTTTLRAGDINGDGTVDGMDLSAWLLSFGAEPSDRLDGSGNFVDINADGFVTAQDLSLLISNVGQPTGGGVEDWLTP